MKESLAKWAKAINPDHTPPAPHESLAPGSPGKNLANDAGLCTLSGSKLNLENTGRTWFGQRRHQGRPSRSRANQV